MKAKFLQFMSGLPVPVYWLGAYAWDLINFLLPCAAIMLLLVVFDINEFTSGQNAG